MCSVSEQGTGRRFRANFGIKEWITVLVLAAGGLVAFVVNREQTNVNTADIATLSEAQVATMAAVESLSKVVQDHNAAAMAETIEAISKIVQSHEAELRVMSATKFSSGDGAVLRADLIDKISEQKIALNRVEATLDRLVISIDRIDSHIRDDGNQ